MIINIQYNISHVFLSIYSLKIPNFFPLHYLWKINSNFLISYVFNFCRPYSRFPSALYFLRENLLVLLLESNHHPSGIFPHSKPTWKNCFNSASSSDWSRFLFLDFLTLLVFFNTSLWTSLGALRLVVCNERVSNLFICSHSSVCDFFSVVHLHGSRLQLVGESEKKERMAHVEKIGFHSKRLSCVRGTQRQFSGKYLFGRRFEI